MLNEVHDAVRWPSVESVTKTGAERRGKSPNATESSSVFPRPMRNPKTRRNKTWTAKAEQQSSAEDPASYLTTHPSQSSTRDAQAEHDAIERSRNFLPICLSSWNDVRNPSPVPIRFALTPCRSQSIPSMIPDSNEKGQSLHGQASFRRGFRIPDQFGRSRRPPSPRIEIVSIQQQGSKLHEGSNRLAIRGV